MCFIAALILSLLSCGVFKILEGGQGLSAESGLSAEGMQEGVSPPAGGGVWGGGIF